MAKPPESSADRVWKEKLEEVGSARDAIAILIIVALIGVLLIAV